MSEDPKLWDAAKTIVMAIKASKQIERQIDDREWDEIEEEWFDWLNELVENYGKKEGKEQQESGRAESPATDSLE